MPQYLLLLRNEDHDFSDCSPSDIERLMNGYFAWAEKLRARGEKLADGGRTLRRRNGKLVIDGPYSEGKEVIGGYYLLTADSEQQAVELARDCPILEWGSIELRAIEDM